MFHKIPTEHYVSNKEQFISRVQTCFPGDTIHLTGTTYSLTLSECIDFNYFTSEGKEHKRYKTNRDFLIASIKRTAQKVWKVKK